MGGACSVNQGSCARTPRGGGQPGGSRTGDQPWRVGAFPCLGVLVARQDRPALARAGVPSGVWTRKCRGSASPGACGRSPDAGRAQSIPRREGASFVSFLPLQQKIGHPPGTGASEASRGALRLPRESPRHAGGIIPPSCSPRPDWGILRARAWARVVDTVRGLPTRTRVVDIVRRLSTPRGGRRHREGVVDTVRGSSTPRGGYNARSCQQRASVPTTRVGSYNQRPRRWPSPAPGATVAQAHWHGNLPTPMGVFPLRCGRPDSGGHCRTRDEHIDGGVERPSRHSRQTPNTRPQEGTGSVASG